MCVAAKKDEVEIPEREAKEKHQKAWEGRYFFSILIYWYLTKHIVHNLELIH